ARSCGPVAGENAPSRIRPTWVRTRPRNRPYSTKGQLPLPRKRFQIVTRTSCLFFRRLEGDATSSRLVCNRNCPQAALMSWPFSRRNVAATPRLRKIDKNFSCRACAGRDQTKPCTVLEGNGLAFAESRLA